MTVIRHPLDDVIQRLRELIGSVDPAVREGIKWNSPSFHTSEHFATFHLRQKQAVQVVLHLGAKSRADVDLRTHITDPGAQLEWRGPDRAIVTFTSVADVDAHGEAFVAVLRQWLAFVR